MKGPHPLFLFFSSEGRGPSALPLPVALGEGGFALLTQEALELSWTHGYRVLSCGRRSWLCRPGPKGIAVLGGWNGLSGELTLPLLPLPPQAPLAAESHPGVLPAGEPAQHGQRVYSDLGDL